MGVGVTPARSRLHEGWTSGATNLGNRLQSGECVLKSPVDEHDQEMQVGVVRAVGELYNR